MEKTTSKKLKIAIVGPESAGKSTLTKQLAEYFKEPYVMEYAREFLKNRSGYQLKDLDFIAYEQLRTESLGLLNCNRFLFCDTNPLSVKVWSLYKYGSCSKKILYTVDKSSYDLHLLMKPDLPYEQDNLRENSALKDRIELFNLFQEELNHCNANYFIIEGLEKKRFKKAITFLKAEFSI